MATSQNKEKFEDYDGFVEKFKSKKTTDDCYTPPLVYDAVADWVAAEYRLKKERFVRPFYPGGDYTQADYTGKVVVDNPPFSILSQIIRFYTEREIPFFLFAPTLCGLARYADFCTVFPVGVRIEYENGAVVNTSFCTNLDPYDIRMRTVPELYQAVMDANNANRQEKRKVMPKYAYPMELVTTATIYPLARCGIAFEMLRSESVRVSKLDAQNGKSIFGCGWLISERLAAERERAERERAERERAERERAERERAERERAERERAERERAERERAERFPLSEREREIVRNLNP